MKILTKKTVYFMYILYVFPMHVKCTTHLILLNFVTPLLRRIQIMRLLNGQVFRTSCFILPLFYPQMFWWGTLKEGDHLEDLGIDVDVILRFVLNK